MKFTPSTIQKIAGAKLVLWTWSKLLIYQDLMRS